MGALTAVFWTAGLSGGWTAKTGGTAGGGSGWATASVTGGINCVGPRPSWQCCWRLLPTQVG